MDVSDGDLIREVLGIAAVFALLAFAVWKLGSGGRAIPWRTSQPSRLETLGRVALTPQHAIHLVRVNADVEATSLPISSALLYVPLIPAGLVMMMQAVLESRAALNKAPVTIPDQLQ